MKKRFTVKSVTKFVVFDTAKRVILKGEFTNVQSADAECRKLNIEHGYLDAASRGDGDEH